MIGRNYRIAHAAADFLAKSVLRPKKAGSTQSVVYVSDLRGGRGDVLAVGRIELLFFEDAHEPFY
jgi:hypothetical protein